MQQDLTEIVVVLDRSGSMASCRTDAEGGLNTFIDDQKKKPGHANFTLVQFDTEYEFVHKGKPIADVPRCVLEPRGSTALLDAVGRTINETGKRLKDMNENDRPGLVVVVIITDGQENASREFNSVKIREMIQHQSDVYKWQFTYLGANQDAFAVAEGMGIGLAATGNYHTSKTHQMFANAASHVARMRSSAAKGEEVKCAFTDEERKLMSGN